MTIFLTVLSVLLTLIGSLNCLASEGLSAVIGGLMASTGFACCVLLWVGSEIFQVTKKNAEHLDHIRIHCASTSNHTQRTAEFWEGRNVRIEN
jgi:hypothetical protein